MISEESKRKFEQIIRSMTPEQRASLQAHLAGASPQQQEQLIIKLISAYESNGLNSGKPAKTVQEPVHETAPASAKKKLKKSVTNTIAGVVAAVLLIGCGVMFWKVKDKLFAPEGESLQETVETAAVTEQTEATATPTPTPEPTATPVPEPTHVPLAADYPDLTGLTVVIDPGHQQTTDNEQELYASWLSATKARCTSGTTGVVTGTPEYELTLQYSLRIADYLEQCGAQVILTRDTDDVNISNQERAAQAVEAQADLFLRIHADAAGDSASSGVRVYYPDTGSFTDTSPAYANDLAEEVAEAEGLEVNAVRATNQYTGLNYANSVRSLQISLGFLSNSDDEAILVNEDNMVAVAQAIAVFCGGHY